MTGCRAPLLLAYLLAEAVTTGPVLSAVAVRAHPQTILFPADLSRRPRHLSLPRDASVAEVRPPILSHHTPVAIPPSR